MNLADAAALKKKGNDLFGRGKYADAVEAYTAAIDLWMETHDRAVLYSNRSAARLKIAGEKQKALSDAERAVQLDPKYAKAHFRKGQALRALGDAAKAVEAMEEVLKLEPSDGAATVALSELRAALGAASAKKPSGPQAGGPNLLGVSPVPIPKAQPSGLAAVAPDTGSAFAAKREESQPAKGIGAVVAKCRNGAKEEYETGDSSAGSMVVGRSDFTKVASTANQVSEQPAQPASSSTALIPPSLLSLVCQPVLREGGRGEGTARVVTAAQAAADEGGGDGVGWDGLSAWIWAGRTWMGPDVRSDRRAVRSDEHGGKGEARRGDCGR